jgi:pyruvate/2-oxoglutarate dehydrogenase complex dihydrolipoamide dehydrogenase (E3) component
MEVEVKTKQKEVNTKILQKQVVLPRTVAVIGSGLVGRSWSIVFARAGFDVQLYDTIPNGK